MTCYEGDDAVSYTFVFETLSRLVDGHHRHVFSQPVWLKAALRVQDSEMALGQSAGVPLMEVLQWRGFGRARARRGISSISFPHAQWKGRVPQLHLSL